MISKMKGGVYDLAFRKIKLSELDLIKSNLKIKM